MPKEAALRPKEVMLRIVFYFTALFATVMALLPHPPHLPFDYLGDKIHAGRFSRRQQPPDP